MTRRKLGTAILAIVAGVGILMTLSRTQAQTAKQPATKALTTAQQNVPAEYQAGLAQLRIGKGYLEKAGDKWGGYRVKGIASIDQAFKGLGVSPESTPQEMESRQCRRA